jgi:hypothetical protein
LAKSSFDIIRIPLSSPYDQYRVILVGVLCDCNIYGFPKDEPRFDHETVKFRACR